MAKKPSPTSPGNDTTPGKAKHLARRFSWDMDDQPPPSNSGDDPEDDSLTTAPAAMSSTATTTTTTTTTITTTVPIASLKRSTTVPMSTVSAVQRPPGHKERSEDAEYWKDLYARRDRSADLDIRTLDIEYDELAKAWKRYQENLPPGVGMECPKLRTAEDVVDVVRAADLEWSSSKYSASWDLSRSLLNRFCLTLPAHSAILSAFGYGEEYVHLFYDVLQSVIKVSVEHRKITEDLSRSLLEVDEAADCCIRDMDFHPPEHAMGSAAKLYTTIFLFLQEILDWYTRKVTCRQLGSLNEDLYGDLHSLVANIKQMWVTSNGERRTATSLGSGGSTGSDHNNTLLLLEEARMGKVGLQGYYRKLAGQSTLTRQLIHDMQADSRQREYLSTERADLLNELLSALKPKLHGLMGPKGRIPVPEIVTPPESSSSSSKSSCKTACFEPEPLKTSADTSVSADDPAPNDTPLPLPMQRIGGSKHKITKMELQYSSREMQDFFHNDDQLVQFELTDEIFAEGLALIPLGEWTTSSLSQIACFTSSHAHTSTLVSAYYASVARKMAIPVISHFCSTASTQAPPMETPSQVSAGLLSLGYSLIRQLIDLSPPVLDFDVNRDISPERFTALTLNHGTLKTWREAISLIDTLLTYAPPLSLIVIDGVECLLNSEDSNSERSLRELVDVLRKHVSRTNESVLSSSSSSSSLLSHPSVCKILFTATSGGSRGLDEVFSTEEVIVADNLRVASPS